MSRRSRDLLSFGSNTLSDSLLVVNKPSSRKRPKIDLNTAKVESELIPAIQDFLAKVKAEAKKGLEDCSSASSSSQESTSSGSSSSSSAATSSAYSSVIASGSSRSNRDTTSSESEETTCSSSSEEESANQQVELNVLFYKRDYNSSESSSSSSSESDSDSD